MERGQELQPVKQAGWLTNITSKISNRELRRVTAGLLAFEVCVGSAALIGTETQQEVYTTACAETDVPCMAAEAGLDVPIAVDASAVLEPAASTTTLPPVPVEQPTTTTAPPVVEEQAPPEPEDPPPRNMSYEAFLADYHNMLALLPDLLTLNQLFPNSPLAQQAEAQLQRIAELDAAIMPSVEKYAQFVMDTSRMAAFADSESYYAGIQPRAIIVHWTANDYPGGVDQFIASLKPFRVEFFIDSNAQTYQLFESDFNRPAHGLSINSFSQGIEIETGEYDGVNSPLFSYTPQQLENTIYTIVTFARRNGLVIDDTTVLGHYAADLLFTNPYYDPASGTFTEPRVRKFDPPQELMRVIIAKSQALDAAIGPR